MNSKLFFIALVSVFFQGVISGTVPTKSEDIKAVPIKANVSVKAEASNGSNETEAGLRIEFTSTTATVPTSLTTDNSTVTNVTTIKTTPETPKPSIPTTTPSKPTTTTTANTSTSTAASTVKPEPVTTVKPDPVPTVKPTPVPTVKPEPVPTATTETSMKAPSSTPATVIQNRSFDAPNFIGGIILTLGLTAIGFIAFKFYKARKAEGNYRTL